MCYLAFREWLLVYCRLFKLRFIASFIAQQRCRASHPVGNRLRPLQPLGCRNGAEERLRLVASTGMRQFNWSLGTFVAYATWAENLWKSIKAGGHACSAEGLGTVRQGLRTKLASCGSNQP